MVATGAMLIGYVALSDGSFRTLHVWQALVSLTSNAAVAWAIMPKYKPLYKMAADGLDPLQASNEYGKSRDIFSEFPQTMLSGNSDYASTGNDRQYRDFKSGIAKTRFENEILKARDLAKMQATISIPGQAKTEGKTDKGENRKRQQGKNRARLGAKSIRQSSSDQQENEASMPG